MGLLLGGVTGGADEGLVSRVRLGEGWEGAGPEAEMTAS